MIEEPILRRNENLKTPILDDQIKIAYLILVHRFPKQFKRLFKAIYDQENYYLIHLDKKAESNTRADVEEFLADYPNAYILESKNVVWGGYSMVQAELNGMKYLLDINATWDFFINLSGQDFPLKSQESIRDYLSQNRGNNFIKIANQASERPETMNRIENYFEETENGFLGIPYERAYLKDIVPYIGGQWMILTRDCCEFICNSKEIVKFERYYQNTLIADESFFQTVIMNTSFKGKIINDDKRAIIWIPDGDIKLRPKTFTMSDLAFLSTGDNLFARKFDDNVDAFILDIMVQNFDSPRLAC
ncbi:MAG TPA: beta-1,6-N-acetylglucosaminyltransferase [Pseudosphingobacterium sp.]|nr:beta-1,6-N-acetylglucosaminyltransferase [Pseudosphingobacterium sp.]